MVNLRLLVALSGLALAGCGGPGITKTVTNPPDPKAPAYQRFVAKRSQELLATGVCKTPQEADARARFEADKQYGPLTPEYSTTWTTGPEARRKAQQEKISSELDKMKREQTAPNPGK